MKVRNHRLFDDNNEQLPYVASPNRSTGTIVPRFLVMHFTAGASASSSISWLTNPAARASAHLVIARDGTVTQLVPFNRKAWHAGRSRWAGLTGLNAHSIGIELDNHGELNGSTGAWRTSWGRGVDDIDVVELAHKHDGKPSAWHRYTEPQLEAALKVSMTLCRKYDLDDVIGHDDIAPGRKRDPGPAFPMATFKSAVLGREDDDDLYDSWATTANLNIRVGPGVSYDKLPASPLPTGTRVEVLERREPWCFVTRLDSDNTDDKSGWVHGAYLARRYG